MPSSFPSSVDPPIYDPTASDTLASAGHHSLHTNANDQIHAIQVALGTTGAPGALLGAYGYNPVPSDVAPRTAIYDGSRSLYNANSAALQSLRAAIGGAITSTGFCKILCLGDSTTEGYGGGSDPSVNSYPVDLYTIMVNRGVLAGGSGWVFTNNQNSGSNADSRWALTGFTNPGAGFNWLQTSTNGATATFTSGNTGTVAQIAIFGVSGAMTLTVDGGTPANGNVSVNNGGSYSGGTITPGGASGVVVVTVTGLSNATHAIRVTTTTTTTSYVIAAQVRGASGLLITNAGIGGSKTTDWDSVTPWYSALSTVKGLDTYNAVIVSLGLNEQSTTQAAFQANLQTIIGNFAGSVILWAPPAPQSPGTGYEGIRTAYYNLADSLGLPLLDTADLLGSYATANANGIRFDGLHLNAPGYAALARGLSQVVLA